MYTNADSGARCYKKGGGYRCRCCSLRFCGFEETVVMEGELGGYLASSLEWILVQLFFTNNTGGGGHS